MMLSFPRHRRQLESHQLGYLVAALADFVLSKMKMDLFWFDYCWILNQVVVAKDPAPRKN